MGLLRRSEAAELRWGDLELQEDGVALLHIRRSKTDPEAEGAVLYVGQAAAQALQAIMPEDAGVVDPAALVFGLSASQIGRRIDAAAKAAGLGEGFTGHSGRVGMAQDLVASGVELPELMTAGRWKSHPGCRQGTPSARRRDGARWPGITREGGVRSCQSGMRWPAFPKPW